MPASLHLTLRALYWGTDSCVLEDSAGLINEIIIFIFLLLQTVLSLLQGWIQHELDHERCRLLTKTLK